MLFNMMLVACGGAIGSVLRYLAAVAGTRWLGPEWPYGTFFVNITGALAMGLVVEAIGRRFNASNELRLFVATGILGGYTTFSTFSLDASAIWERGDGIGAFFYVAASVLVGIAALFAGLAIGRNVF